MITQFTAQRISDVIDEMEDCKSAIHLMKNELDSAGKPEIFVNVAANKNDDGITITLAPSIAKEAIEKQAELLANERAALNETAIKEAKD